MEAEGSGTGFASSGVVSIKGSGFPRVEGVDCAGLSVTGWCGCWEGVKGFIDRESCWNDWGF